jgi:excisionase family DNA binding protein
VDSRHDRGAFLAEAVDLSATGKGLVRVDEAARWLGLGRTKAWELVYSGALHSVTIGRSRRVPIASLHAFVQRLVEEGGV